MRYIDRIPARMGPQAHLRKVSTFKARQSALRSLSRLWRDGGKDTTVRPGTGGAGWRSFGLIREVVLGLYYQRLQALRRVRTDKQVAV